MKWRGVLILAVIFWASASSASAAPFTPGLERAYNAAVQYWGGTPTGCSSIDREIVPDGALPDEFAGLATEPPLEVQVPCVLYISRWLAKPLNWGSLCIIMVHEMGHLYGLGHSEDPENIMYPVPTKPPAICARLLLRETRWAGT